MTQKIEIRPGLEIRSTRRIEPDDIQAAVHVTRDRGRWHLDEKHARDLGFRGLVAPGLLTASVVSEVGGKIDFLATMMHFEFLAPVCAGDLVEAIVRIDSYDASTRKLCASFEVHREGRPVLRGKTEGFHGGPPKRAR